MTRLIKSMGYFLFGSGIVIESYSMISPIAPYPLSILIFGMIIIFAGAWTISK